MIKYNILNTPFRLVGIRDQNGRSGQLSWEMHPLLGGIAVRWGRRRGDLSLSQHEVLRRQAEEQAQAEQEERGHHRSDH